MKTIIFLYVIIFGYDSAPTERRIEMPNFKTCFEAVQNHKSKISNGDEAESGIVLFCGTEKAQRCVVYSSGSYHCKPLKGDK